MDFAGFIYAGPESLPPDTTWFNQAELGHPELDAGKWGAVKIASSTFWTPGNR